MEESGEEGMRFDAVDDRPKPDWGALVDCILRKGTPKRVHHIELLRIPSNL
ncbi:MAG: hypothetical protein ACLFV5_05995 [Anaerolineales bacterium]